MCSWDSYQVGLVPLGLSAVHMAVMFDTSTTYVDVQVFNGNEVLFHWVFDRTLTSRSRNPNICSTVRCQRVSEIQVIRRASSPRRTRSHKN